MTSNSNNKKKEDDFVDFPYTFCFCEENVYKFFETLAPSGNGSSSNTPQQPVKGRFTILRNHSFAMWISGYWREDDDEKTSSSSATPWHGKSWIPICTKMPPSAQSKEALQSFQDVLTVWDYHVVALVKAVKREEEEEGGKSVNSGEWFVVDFNTKLGTDGKDDDDGGVVELRMERTEEQAEEDDAAVFALPARVFVPAKFYVPHAFFASRDVLQFVWGQNPGAVVRIQQMMQKTRFKLVPWGDFLTSFRSDRRHMVKPNNDEKPPTRKDEDDDEDWEDASSSGSSARREEGGYFWEAKPPSYPCIQSASPAVATGATHDERRRSEGTEPLGPHEGSKSNVVEFICMESNRRDDVLFPDCVVTLSDLLKKVME